MAEKVTKKQIQDLKVEQYQEIRATLSSGDLLFASGNYWVSKAIRKTTLSAWSHVGILFNVQSLNRILLLESVEDIGVRFAPLSKYLSDYEKSRPYRGEIIIARAKGVNPKVQKRLAQVGIDELTKPYDTNEVAKILARISLRRGKWKRDREYICSELVYECFYNAGKLFEFDKRGFISPENIWRDTSVSFMQRIL